MDQVSSAVMRALLSRNRSFQLFVLSLSHYFFIVMRHEGWTQIRDAVYQKQSVELIQPFYSQLWRFSQLYLVMKYPMALF